MDLNYEWPINQSSLVNSLLPSLVSSTIDDPLYLPGPGTKNIAQHLALDEFFSSMIFYPDDSFSRFNLSSSGVLLTFTTFRFMAK